MEYKALQDGEVIQHPKGSLRWNAQILLMKGEAAAINMVADRLDGKVPQAVVGDDEHDPIRVDTVTDEQRKAAVAALLGKK